MKTSLLFSSFPFISSDKVTLTRMTELDLAGLWEIMGDEENYRFSPTAALLSPDECVTKLRRADAMFRDKQAIVLGIYPNDRENKLVGTLEISGVDTRVESVTISFTLNREYTGMGYASGAVRAAADYLMNTVGVHRIQAYVLPINYRAVLVLESCGFVKEGTIREGFYWPDKGIVDLTLFSLLPTDLKKKAPGSSGPAYYL